MQSEPQYQGRAQIKESFNELQIAIPSRKRIISLIGFTLMILIALPLIGFSLFYMDATSGADTLFIAACLIEAALCCYIMTLLIRCILWVTIGGEVICIDKNYLSIEWKGTILPFKKVYDLKSVQNLRVEETYPSFNPHYPLRALRRSNPAWRIDLPKKYNGLIFFNYGQEVTSFGQSIDVTEARYLASKIQTFLAQ